MFFHNLRVNIWKTVTDCKNQLPKIIYWESQNNSNSCFNNSISSLANQPKYYTISDKIQMPKIIYWEVAILLKGQNYSISCFNNSLSCLAKEPNFYNISC